MARPRSSPWFDSSQVFADTRRIDLFDDPPWESSPPMAGKRVPAVEEQAESRWTVVKSSLLGRVLTKRGLHSQKPT